MADAAIRCEKVLAKSLRPFVNMTFRAVPLENGLRIGRGPGHRRFAVRGRHARQTRSRRRYVDFERDDAIAHRGKKREGFDDQSHLAGEVDLRPDCAGAAGRNVPRRRRKLYRRATAGCMDLNDRDFVRPCVGQIKGERRDCFTGLCVILFGFGIENQRGKIWRHGIVDRRGEYAARLVSERWNRAGRGNRGPGLTRQGRRPALRRNRTRGQIQAEASAQKGGMIRNTHINSK